MIIVDTSVRIDYFNGVDTAQTERLDGLLGVEPLGIGDLILTEVLQGFRTDAAYRTGKKLLASLTPFEMLGMENAYGSAENYRLLRKQGLAIRKTADVIIATFCISEGHALLYSDKDFEPFVDRLDLVAA